MQNKVIKVIYTFFVGILLAIFVGVGIAAFYTESKRPELPAELEILRVTDVTSMDEADKSAKLIELQLQYNEEIKGFEKQMMIYNRNVSIIALVAAILILVISLITFRNLEVIADGLLLGGVITLLYSVVRIFGSGDDKVRFVVVGVGLLTALVLGYVKFIRQQITSEVKKSSH